MRPSRTTVQHDQKAAHELVPYDSHSNPESVPIELDYLKDPSAISQTISRYKIVKKLGEGGTGEVYLAQDLLLDRKVTIKSLRPEWITDERARKRLIRGAQAAAKLAHPNIRTVYDVFEERREVFIVMEYLSGETLSCKIRHQALDVHESIDVAVQLVDALAEAHQRGIIHRDVKPQNIMITAQGETKLLDFGIAKALPLERTVETAADTQTWLTRPGIFVGTPVYASPEQLRKQTIDARSDIFSFGLVLHEMLTGRRPFAAGSTAEEVSNLLTQEPPPLKRYDTQVPSKLKRIVRKCLERKPDNRYQSARELAIDLKKVKRDSDSGVIRGSRRQVRSLIRAPAADARALIPSQCYR